MWTAKATNIAFTHKGLIWLKNNYHVDLITAKKIHLIPNSWLKGNNVMYLEFGSKKFIPITYSIYYIREGT